MKEMLFSLAFILCSTGIQSVHPMVLAGIRCDWRRSSESNFSKGAAPCRPATPDRGGMRHIWICGRPGRRAIGNAKAAIGQWACSMSTRIRWACIAEWYRGASLGRGAAQAPSKGAVRAAAPVVGGSGQAASDAVLAKPSLDTRPMRNSVTSGNQLMVVPIAECLGNQVLREAQPCWGGGAHSAALCSRCRPWWMRRVRICGPLHRRRRLRAKLRRQRYPWTTRMPCLSAASPCVCARVYACPHRNGADDGGQAGAPSAHDVGRDGMADGSFLVG